jgi:hypothetical protein
MNRRSFFALLLSAICGRKFLTAEQRRREKFIVKLYANQIYMLAEPLEIHDPPLYDTITYDPGPGLFARQVSAHFNVDKDGRICSSV